MRKNVFKSMVMIASLIFLMGVASIGIAQDTATGDDTQQGVTSQHRAEMRGLGNF